MSQGVIEIKRGNMHYPDGICPICRHQGYCATTVSEDGSLFIICKRDISKSDIMGYKYIKETGKGFSMFLKKDGQTGDYRTTPIDIKKVKSNDIVRFADSKLHRINSKLLSMLTLSPQHRKILHDWKFTDEMISRYGFKTFPEVKDRWKIAKSLYEEFGDLTGFPGAYIKDKEDSRYWTLTGFDGIVFPITNIYGEIVMLQIRLDNPGPNGKYKPLSSAGFTPDGKPRYQNGCTPNSRIGIVIPPVLGDTYVCHVTEGYKKAIKVVENLGCLCISVQGVGSWSELVESNEKGETMIEVLKRQYGVKMVIISYDIDRFKNGHVMVAQDNVVNELKKHDLYVGESFWDGHAGKGIDDCIDNGYKPYFRMI